MRLRLIDAGFPIPAAQVEVIDAAGSTRFLDLAYRHRKIAIEYDGREFHTADADQDQDAGRHRLLVAVGYRFVTARYEQIFGTDNSFEREVGELIGMTPIDRWW
jgi:very-short-patch-repair endonuclease